MRHGVGGEGWEGEVVKWEEGGVLTMMGGVGGDRKGLCSGPAVPVTSATDAVWVRRTFEDLHFLSGVAPHPGAQHDKEALREPCSSWRTAHVRGVDAGNSVQFLQGFQTHRRPTGHAPSTGQDPVR